MLERKQKLATIAVECTTKEGLPKECIQRHDMETACLTEGYERYAQLIGTPFTKEPLFSEVGAIGEKEGATRILEGTLDTSRLDEYTAKFIDELKRPPEVLSRPSITGKVSTKDYCKAWRRVRKKTVASPFGPSFSELIAGTYNPEVAEIDAAMESIPMSAGYPPEQWERGVDQMIPKKKHTKHVTELRIIALLEARFNSLNKRIGREVLKQAEEL